MINIKEIFEKYEDKYLKFEEIKNKSSNRPDLHAFILLDILVPGKFDIVSCAAHDEFWLEVTPEQLAKVATEKDILDLIKCGIRYDDDVESFCMFV